MEIITGALYAESGHTATALKNTNARATKNASEMSYKELIEALINACDKEIASKNV
jgi:hypothetical protein